MSELRLVPFSGADLEAVAAWFDDPETRRWLRASWSYQLQPINLARSTFRTDGSQLSLREPYPFIQ